ncbi:MAG: hypothetical protein EPO21_11645 [Chloroflexota bacterium]|nr:MAG: hypothetical protein EPO21_11645 [Chloroflexota bacterium]
MAAWVAFEIGSSVLDAVTTVQTWQDPEASLKEKVGVTGLFLVGAAGPGGGYATGAKMATKMAKVRQLGHAGEELAGITRNTRRIVTPGGGYRIPDEIVQGSNLIREVKNVGSLSYTKQLRDIATYAQTKGYDFELIVRQDTSLSGPLEDAIEQGVITLNRLLP